MSKQFSCEKTTFEEYKEKFKADNPGIPLTMLGIASEASQDDSTEGYDNSEGDEYEWENNKKPTTRRPTSTTCTATTSRQSGPSIPR